MNWIFILVNLLRSIFTSPKEFLKRIFGRYEIVEIEFEKFSKLLKSPAVIIEAGAFDGRDSIELARVFPGSKIFSLEPNQPMFYKLKSKTESYKNIVAINKCLVKQDFSGISIPFYCDEESPSSSLLKPKNNWILPKVSLNQQLDVEGVSLSSILHEYNLSKVDLLFLDLQGFEYQILEDFFLKNDSRIIKFIYSEVTILPQYENAVNVRIFNKMLKNYGFVPLIKRIPLISGNILYRNTRI